MYPSSQHFIPYLSIGLAIYFFLQFVLNWVDLQKHPSVVSPYDMFVLLGPLAAAVSMGILAHARLSSSSWSRSLSVVMSIGLGWGSLWFLQYFYPWNVGLAVGLLLIGIVAMGRRKILNDTEKQTLNDRVRRYLQISFVVLIVILSVLPLKLQVTNERYEEFFSASLQIRLGLWVVSLIAIGVFYFWTIKNQPGNRDSATNRGNFQSLIAPFLVAAYVAVNGFVLGLLLRMYADQCVLAAISAIFFYWYSHRHETVV